MKRAASRARSTVEKVTSAPERGLSKNGGLRARSWQRTTPAPRSCAPSRARTAPSTRAWLTKAPIYAAAGVPEYWIVNLRQEQLEVYRSPDPAARRYTVVEIVQRGGRGALPGLPDVVVAVTDLLP
jgi:hypothetical protein